MAEQIKSSLIIATYNWKEALELVLKSVMTQSKLPYEVIIADDGSTNSTKELVDHYRNIFPVPLIHVWHEDKGFRLSIIRNKAISKAKGNYIIQIDGDTILHRNFVKDHESFAQEGQFISGSRVLLSEEYSSKIISTKNFKFNIFSKPVNNKHYHLRLPLLTKKLAKPSRDVQFVIRTVRGCNMSFWKKDLLLVNGYNEDMIGWGREDSEISARLVHLGLSKINLKFSAIQYHIYHPENSKTSLNINDSILEETIRRQKISITNGIDQTRQESYVEKIPVTAIIPTFNEENNINEVIQNLNFADEIIVIDSFSTDNTVKIAQQNKVKIIQHPFKDFSSQKNFAIAQAKHDWIFILDADERITGRLKKEIIQKINSKQHLYKGFWIPRKNYFKQKLVRFSGWQNDKVLRLFNKNFCLYNGKLVHEEITCNGKISSLKSPILHYTYNNYQEYIHKIDKYASLKAQELYRKGTKPNSFYGFVKPAYRFIYHYIITFGFLDGKTGWTIAKINAIGMYRRYAKLKELHLKKIKQK